MGKCHQTSRIGYGEGLMAKMDLTVNILAKVDKALREISKIKTQMNKMGDETVKQTDKATLSAKRMGASLALVGMIASKAFKAITKASPSMQVAFILMGVEADNAWRSIGENLAPVISDILMPAINSLSEYVQALAPEIQTWIGLTMGVTLVILALVAIVAILGAATLPLVGAIFLLGGAIAFMILASQGYLDGMAEKSEDWAIAINIATIAFKILSAMLKMVFFSVVGYLVAVWEAIKLIIGGLYNMVKGIVDIFIGAGIAIKGFLSGDLDMMTKGLEQVGVGFSNFFIGIANIILGIVKFVILQIMGIAKTITNALDIETPKLDTAIENVKGWGIEYKTSFHEGGTVDGPRDVNAWLKPKERVRTETQESALQRELNGRNNRSQKMTVNLTINYPSFNERQDIDRLVTVIERRLTQSQYQRSYI